MLLVLTPQITPRLTFIFNFIFSGILKTEVSFTSDEEYFQAYTAPKLIYGDSNIQDALFFQRTGLLHENDISVKKIEFIEWDGQKVFFPVKAGALPFDPFAAAFYLVSRYEEYLPHVKDRHKRFNPEGSVAWKGQFLDKPVVNIWANAIRKLLSEKFSNYTFPLPSFTFTPTIDIDNAFAFQHKGFLKNSYKIIKHVLAFQPKALLERLMVLARLKRDPYDSYKKQEYIHAKYNLWPVYFILLGDKGKFDRNLSFRNTSYRNLINRLKNTGALGIHPSYNSNKNAARLLEEKKRLENIARVEIVKSRQHYIKLSFPSTYQNLIAMGIKEDFSMGYPSVCGFRAGTSTPFYFYNLEKEAVTTLKVFPFAFMDTTLKVYLKKRSKEILPYVKEMIGSVKEYGGNLIFIFHNESLGTGRRWKHWEDMYECIIKLCLKEE